MDIDQTWYILSP